MASNCRGIHSEFQTVTGARLSKLSVQDIVLWSAKLTAVICTHPRQRRYIAKVSSIKVLVRGSVMQRTVSMQVSLDFSPCPCRNENVLDLGPGRARKRTKRFNVRGSLIRRAGSLPGYECHAFVVVVSDNGWLFSFQVSSISPIK